MKALTLYRIPILLAVVALVAMASSSSAQQPSPRLKQLEIGCYTYGGSDIWRNTALANWYAERYSFAIGSNDAASIPYLNSMKNVNPHLHALKYELFVLMAGDTVKVKQWADSMGYNFDSLVIRTKTGPGDSLICRASTVGDFYWWRTTKPGAIVTFSGFTDAQTRFAWDFRNPKVGEYLAYMWKNQANSIQYDGIFVDEEYTIGATGMQTSGLFPRMFPFRDGTNSYYLAGSIYSNIQRPWGNTFDLEDADNTHSWIDIRDSLRRAREGWMKVAGEKMKEYGLLYTPNFATTPVNNLSNWTNEGRRAGQLAGSFIIGEYSYFYPGEANLDINCKTLIQACYSARNDDMNLYVGWIRMGQYDLGTGISYDRSKINGLGLMLASLFPGQCRYYFSPCVKNGQVDFYLNRTVNNITAHDSTTLWSYAWGKYFGVPLTTRDTALTGTDGAGQAYQVWKVRLDKPSAPGTTQTLAVGRFAKGTNFDLGATSVVVQLGGSYYQLQANGTYTGPVTSATIGNAEWEVYVSDTTLANNGPSQSGVDVTPPAKVNDLGAVSGPQVGELSLNFTETGDDGFSGTAQSIELRARDSASGNLDANNWSQSTVIRLITPQGGNSPRSLLLNQNDGLAIGEPYFFGVRVFDEAGNVSLVSNTPKARTLSNISTNSDECLAEPVSPADGARLTMGRPTFSVNTNSICDSLGITAYEFVIASDSDFTNIVAQSGLVASTVGVTSWQPGSSFENNARYYWHVRPQGESFSAVRTFDVELAPFGYPTTVNPMQGEVFTLTELPTEAVIVIALPSGARVKRASATGGEYIWDGTNDAGQPVASGVYLWYIENGDARGKLVIAR